MNGKTARILNDYALMSEIPRGVVKRAYNKLPRTKRRQAKADLLRQIRDIANMVFRDRGTSLEACPDTDKYEDIEP